MFIVDFGVEKYLGVRKLFFIDDFEVGKYFGAGNLSLLTKFGIGKCLVARKHVLSMISK